MNKEIIVIITAFTLCAVLASLGAYGVYDAGEYKPISNKEVDCYDNKDNIIQNQTCLEESGHESYFDFQAERIVTTLFFFTFLRFDVFCVTVDLNNLKLLYNFHLLLYKHD